MTVLESAEKEAKEKVTMKEASDLMESGPGKSMPVLEEPAEGEVNVGVREVIRGEAQDDLEDPELEVQEEDEVVGDVEFMEVVEATVDQK